DHCRRRQQRLAEELARVREARIEAAHRQQPGAHQPVFRVEKQGPEAFDRVGPESREQERTRVIGREEPGAFMFGRGESPAAEFDGRQNPCGLGPPDAGDALELGVMEPGEPLYATSGAKNGIGDGECTDPLWAVANHERDEFVVAERTDAVAPELLARSVVGHDVLHAADSCKNRARSSYRSIGLATRTVMTMTTRPMRSSTTPCRIIAVIGMCPLL